MSYKIRFRLAQIILPLTMLGFYALMATSCTSSFASDNKVRNFTGEDIFKAIYFKEGEAAKLIPTLNSKSIFEANVLTREELAQKKDLMYDLIQNIKASNSSYFTEFEKMIKSDDYNTISEALKNSADVMLQAGLVSAKYGKYYKEALALTKDADVSKFDLKTEEGRKSFRDFLVTKKNVEVNEEAIALAFFIVVAVAIWEAAALINVIAVTTVAAATIAVDVTVAVHYTHTKTKTTSLESMGGSMHGEKIVYELANNF